MPRVHGHADAGHPFAGGLPATHALEQDEVAGPGYESAEQQQGLTDPTDSEPIARQNGQHHQDADRAASQDHHVQDGRERARADARDLEIEDHVLRSLHLEMLPVVRRRCAQRGHAAIVISLGA